MKTKERAKWRTVRCSNCRGIGMVSVYSRNDFEGPGECPDCGGGGTLYVSSRGAIAKYPGGPFRGFDPKAYENGEELPPEVTFPVVGTHFGCGGEVEEEVVDPGVSLDEMTPTLQYCYYCRKCSPDKEIDPGEVLFFSELASVEEEK